MHSDTAAPSVPSDPTSYLDKETATVMRTLALITTAATAVTVAACTAGVSLATTPPAHTLHLLDVSQASTPAFDAGTGAPRPGDRVFLRDALFTWKAGRRGAPAGHIDSTLTFHSPFGRNGATAEIGGQLFLAGGSLLAEGIVRITEGPNRFTLAIVGGTGIYAGAQGTLTSRDIGASGDKSTVDIRLLP